MVRNENKWEHCYICVPEAVDKAAAECAKDEGNGLAVRGDINECPARRSSI